MNVLRGENRFGFRGQLTLDFPADYITFNCDGVSEGFEITLKGYTVFVDYTARLCNDELAEFTEVPAVWDRAGRECPEIAEALQLMLN
ncbi:hypothetical protein [uncultured Parabacteroides sp.]|uniref:hypothetical protein n=1 Tax=uncultured Parabacteroides sp. TaxID=512312 RepID=UPI002595B6EF|nr:hypothetical protein [uncultured Parabacteroides sp.]